MNEQDAALEERAVIGGETMKIGLLMESASAHQRMAEAHLDQLTAHTRGLDRVVRDEIRRTLIDELRMLSGECERAAGALRRMHRTASMRAAAWNAGIALFCTAIPVVVVQVALPSPASVAGLRQQRDQLAQNIARLEQRGGKIEWRACGGSKRLCVRIDRSAPVYGENTDYYVAKGY